MVFGNAGLLGKRVLLLGAFLFGAAVSPARGAVTAGFDSPASSVAENAGSVSIAVRLSGASDVRVTVSYAVAGGTASAVSHGSGTDYVLAAGTLAFDPGVTVREIPVQVLDDAVNETDETVTVSLSIPSGAEPGSAMLHTLTIFDNDRALLLDVKKDCGAAGDGVTDDTAAIQAAVNRAAEGGGGVVLFPAGTYLATSVEVRPGITFEGYGATIRRPPNQGKWTRTFTTGAGYSGAEDSRPLIIRGLTFDGNSASQGPYKNYELEQAALVFLGAAADSPGRLTAVVEDCVFRNGVGDAVHFYTNVRGKMYHCTATDVFRGGFVLTGGNSDIEVRDLVTSGRTDPTGIDIEVDGPGYGGSKKVNVLLEDLNLVDGDFDIGVSDSSTVTGRNITAAAPFNLYGEDSVLKFTDSKFGVGVQDGFTNRVCVPQSLTFERCEFTVTEAGAAEADRDLAAIQIYWNFSWLPRKYDELVLFTDCRFLVDGTVEAADRVMAVDSLPCSGLARNTVKIAGGSISSGYDIGVYLRQGGKTALHSVEVAADTPVSFTGWGGTGDNDWSCDVTLDRIRALGKNYLFMEYDNAGNRLYLNGETDAASNTIISPQGLRNTVISGSRTIIGDQPPTAQTQGFKDDLYRLRTPANGEQYLWKCTRAGYKTSAAASSSISSAWESLPELGVEDAQPAAFRLNPPSPNPFNPSTALSFSLPSAGAAMLTVYNISGQKVRGLVNGTMSAGAHSVVWDGRDDSGKTVSSGVYLARLVQGNHAATARMLLAK